MRIRFRDAEGCEPQQNFIWDSAWINTADAGYADWIMADDEDPVQMRGGMRARMQLLSSVVMCLFTDRRLPEELAAPGNQADDPRGWWGDSLRLAGEPEAELGSLLWTLERSPLTDQTASLAKSYCEEALQVITDQGAVARFEVETSVDRRGFLAIEVRAFDHAGLPNLAQVFEVLWQQIANPAAMTFAR